MKGYLKSRLAILVCHLIILAIVRPLLEVNVQLLHNEFVNECWDGDEMLYVSMFDKDGNLAEIKQYNTWREHWKSCNDIFK